MYGVNRLLSTFHELIVYKKAAKIGRYNSKIALLRNWCSPGCVISSTLDVPGSSKILYFYFLP